MPSCLILGGTGLVGGELIRQLIEDDSFSRINSLSRRELGIKHEKLQEFIIDLDRMEEVPDAFQVDVIFCCLGTTIKTAGSKEQFKKVDYHYPIKAAQLSKNSGVKTFILISSLGADSHSPIFYSKTKGEVERDLKKLDLPNLHIIRPSILDGDRTENRPGEKLGLIIAKMAAPLFIGPLKKYKPSKIEDVASEMRSLAK